MKKGLIGALVLVLVAGAFVLDTVISAGGFRTIEPHFAGRCERVSGVVGVEDITIDPASGLAYLSAHDRRGWREDGTKAGAIYVYRPGSFARPLRMAHDFAGDFHPHGISLWRNAAGSDRLFVVNHPKTPKDNLSQVEIFEIEDGRLRHVKSVLPDAAYSLNDVAAVGADSFFATIDKGSLTPLGRTLETFGRLPRGGIAYGFSGQMQKVQGGLVYPNGIQVDGSMVYVAETSGQRLVGFERSGPNGALTEVFDMPIDSGLDNIEFGDNGTLWIGAHPRMIDFPPHGQDAANRSPSQVLVLAPADTGFALEELYLNDGDPLSGASVAAPYKDRFLIGSVFEPLILDCGM